MILSQIGKYSAMHIQATDTILIQTKATASGSGSPAIMRVLAV
jgi:hypothetical protein